MLANLIIAALSVSTIFIVVFFLAISFIYKNAEKKRLKIRNTFIFEAVPSFKNKDAIVNGVLLFSLAVILFTFIFYVSQNIHVFSVSLLIITVIAVFCLATIPFIGLDKLREHLYLSLGALVAILAIFGVEAYFGFRSYSLYLRDYDLVGAIISSVFALLCLIVIFNPKLLDLKNTQNEAGEYVRKNFILLAFTEWMMYPAIVLSLLPLLFFVL